MKFLRLYSDNAVTDKNGFSWNIPLQLEHEEVGMASVHVEFQPDTGSYSRPELPPTIPIQCSLIKENMWNVNGVFYNLDLSEGQGWATAARSGEIGK